MSYEVFFNHNNEKTNKVVCTESGTPVLVYQELLTPKALWISTFIYHLWDVILLEIKKPVTFHDQNAIDILAYIRNADTTPSSAENLNKLFDFTFVATLSQDAVRPSSATKLRSSSLEGALHLLFTSNNILDSVTLCVTPKG